MVSMKERIALIKAISRGSQRRRMFSESLQLYVALRRKRMILLLSLTGLLLFSRNQNVGTDTVHLRSCRRLPRNNNGLCDMVWNSYTDERFKKTFRISKNTFNFILSPIRNDLEHQTINEDPITPECRLAICIYRLGRGDKNYYYTIAKMAGLGASTVHEIVTQVCWLITEHLWEECVMKHIPRTEQEFKQKMKEMNDKWQFPFCWATIDECHIPIKCPPGGAASCKEYHKFKNFDSVVLMAMVDSRDRFIWASCGFPGNSHDAIIFQSTALWEKLKGDDFIPDIGHIRWLIQQYVHLLLEIPLFHSNRGS